MHRNKFGVYYYRYTLPRYIREQHPSLPKSITRTLETHRRSEAIYLVSKWHALVHEALTKLLVDGILDLPYTLNKSTYARKVSLTEITKLEEDYIRERICTGNWRTDTVERYTGQFGLFRRITGKVYVEEITHDDVALYKRTMLQLPKNITKYPQLNGRSIKRVLQITKQENLKLLSATTVQANLTRMKSFLAYCYKGGYIKQPIHEHLNMPKNKQALQRKPFSESDLQKLFGYVKTESWQKQTKQYQYWLPLLAYYTGARINELCQLHMVDVVYVDNVLCISINDNDDKRLKNTAAKRIIPLHKHLLELGFETYIEMLRCMKHKYVFEELDLNSKCKFGHTASKWFSAYKKTVGITEQAKVFHSFRHTFANTLKQNGVEEALAAALLGHTYKSMSYGTYGSNYQMQKLQETVNKISQINLL